MNYINNFQVIHEYSRAQAIEDGFLIDLTDNALEAGIKWSLAVTSEVR
jgi:type I site-specific restriction endonuclease